MIKMNVAAVLAIAFCSNFVHAEEQKPNNELTYNVSVVSDYRYRGISQSRLNPALQGGADFINNPTGLYVGTWLSTIKWIEDQNGNGNVEWDVYFGKRGEIVKDVSYDVGLLSYVYHGNNLPTSANTTELYGQVSYGPVYAKYSYALTDLFGFADSRGSGYLDVGATFDVAEGVNVALHAGHQTVSNVTGASYSDWKIGVTKDFKVATVGLALTGTNSKFYTCPSTANCNLGKTGFVVSLSKTF